MSITRDLRLWMNGMYGSLITIMAINVIVFITLNVILNTQEMSGTMSGYMAVSSWTDLPANPSVLLHRFWTPISYMFVHYSFGHLLSNMLWLYFLGRLFCELLGKKRFTIVYIVGGLTGALLFVIFSNLLPKMGNAQLEGASAGVMAIVVGVAAYSPDYRVHIRFPMFFPIFDFYIALKWIGLIAFVLTSVIDLASNTGGKVAHIGGAALGFLYGTQFRKKKDIFGGLISLFSFNFKKNKLRVAHTRSAKANDEFYNTNKSTIRKRVDEILDKISRSGYDSLSREEKDFLQKNHDKF